jgi:hypothetical protein
MRRFSPKILFYCLLSMWFLLNLVQAIAMEITLDESYYWLWGQFPSLGYFDHPPMVGWLTYLGDLVFSGNLSVRIITVILQPISILILSRVADVQLQSFRNVLLFWLIVASMTMFNVYGFITTPDVPLLFFASLFLLAYQKFLQKNDFLTILFLSATMAGMIYSKYHGGLLILLIIFSNLKLLLNLRFYMAGILALFILSPHIFWQIQNNFPGFSYHLHDRVSGFNWYNPLEYWLNQFLVFNPVTFIVAIWVIRIRKTKDQFEKSLRYIFIGFLIFFWITSFRGHAEPHWTVVGSLPLLVLVYRESLSNERICRYLMRYVQPSLILVFVARILLVSGLLPERLDFNGKNKKHEAYQSVAGHLPVIFTGSFQAPSLYRYFTGKEATVISAIESRKTQYDIWKFDTLFSGRRVFIPSEYPGKSKVYTINGFRFDGFFTDSLQVTNHLKVDIISPPTKLQQNKIVKLKLIVKNESNYAFYFNHPIFPAVLKPMFINNKGELVEMTLIDVKRKDMILPHNQLEVDITCSYEGNIKGDIDFAIMSHSFFGHTLNSKIFSMLIY